MNRPRIEIRVDGIDNTAIVDQESLNRAAGAAALILRLKAEFLEMPGLKLTGAQACRLWALDAVSCSDLLDAMVNENFLFRTRDGAFMRIERAVPSKAALPAQRTPASAA